MGLSSPLQNDCGDTGMGPIFVVRAETEAGLFVVISYNQIIRVTRVYAGTACMLFEIGGAEFIGLALRNDVKSNVRPYAAIG